MQSVDPRRYLKCSRCGKEYPYDQVRYLVDRSGVACNTCLGIADQERVERRKREGRLYGFQCVHCKYRFSRSVTHRPERCPQCSEKELIMFDPERLTADNLLKYAEE